jgi:amino acid adenylation domain-containing protein
LKNEPESSPIQEFLSTLRRKNLTIAVRGDRLVVDAPEGIVTGELRDQLAARKEDIIGFLREAGAAAVGTITATAAAEPAPLSFAQQRMWFLDQLESLSTAFNSPVQVRFRGPLNVVALARGITEILRRHDVLRTNFPIREGRPVTVVRPPGPADLELIDCSSGDDAERERIFQDRMEEQASAPFSLAADPLVRTVLLRRDRDDHILLLTVHHIVSDGWSIGVFLRELSSLYASFDQGVPHLLPEPELQYADFSRWQHSTIAGEKLEHDLAYWKSALEGAPDLLTLPADKPRPAFHRYEGGKVQFAVDPKLTAALRSLGEGQNATLFMTLLAAYAALLSKLNGIRDIVIGCPIAGRRRKEIESLIGCFINTLVLRSDLADNPTFSRLVAQVRRSSAEAYEHQDLPFEKLVDELQPERNLGRNPLFQVAFLFQNVPIDAADFPGMEVLPRGEQQFTPGVTFDLTLVMEETTAGGLRGDLEYNRTLFDHETVERVSAMFQTFLAAAVREPDSPVLDLEILDSPTREHLLYTRNETVVDYPRSLTVPRLFERQVEETPDDIAIICEGRTATYDELNKGANQLARLLQSRGIGQGSIVGIMLERSIDLLVGLLGIMKSGGAYLPIDATFPDGRIRQILASSGVDLLLTHADSLSGRTGLTEYESRVLDVCDRAAQACATDNLQCHIDSSDPVYVIYTSGSTGEPKGVIVEHGSLTNYIWWARRYVDGERLDFPLYTSLSFDLTVTSLYTPLISGGRIIVYREPTESRVPLILQVFQDKAADIVKLTPAHLALIKDLDMTDSRVRKLIVGGDDLKTDLARRIHDVFGENVEIYNEYGPTEATVGCMIHRYDAEKDTAGSVPIGVPADNARIYLLDDNQHPVPPGAIGEMYISGDGVASGYLNQEELTRERFSPDPFVPGARMYRTGDLARWRNENVMEYCGRVDRQVKIRGVRVELGEIEAGLRSHTGVRECIVDVIHLSRPMEDADDLEYCVHCGLASNYPGTTFDAQGLCSQCRAFEQYRHKVEPYFKDMDEFEAILRAAQQKKQGTYDCMVLFSGGKDSTYALARIADMDLKILAYTLDNGYISDQAKDNIRRVVAALGVDHIFGTTPHMNAIFADSLARHSNVCNGCFKALYTLSMNIARDEGIPCIITGLSRGQQFETRLSNFYRADNFCVDKVDRFIKEARKVYHRLDDEVSRRLDVTAFKEDQTFDEIQIHDFFRYCDAGLEELYSYLDGLPWERPSDTGRSTNCRINDVGIYIHKKERRYHNYAMPYAWDVRMGHKQREDALEELDDSIDVDEVRRMLAEVGYDENGKDQQRSGPVLAAYYVPEAAVEARELREHLTERLSEAMIPTTFVALDKIPLTRSGKVDRRALAEMQISTEGVDMEYVAPRTSVEQQLVGIWSQLLGLDRIGIHENFFRLGGHSLLAAQVIGRIAEDLHVELPVGVLFDKATIEELAFAVAERQSGNSHQDDDAALEDILSEVEEMTDEEAQDRLRRDTEH